MDKTPWRSKLGPQYGKQFGEVEMPGINETGRGWEMFNDPVALEPDLTLANRPPRILIDDGRLPSREPNGSWGALAVLFPSDRETSTPRSVAPEPSGVISIPLCFPQQMRMGDGRMVQFLASSAHSLTFLGFEVIGTHGDIRFQFCVSERDIRVLRSQLQIHFPEIALREESKSWRSPFVECHPASTVVVDFGLRADWFLPMNDRHTGNRDLLVPLISAMHDLEAREGSCLQIVIRRTRCRWREEARSFLFDTSGTSRFRHLERYNREINAKLSEGVFAVSVRLLTTGAANSAALQIARRSGAFFRQFSSVTNELIPLENDPLKRPAQVTSFLNRFSYRKGMLLSPSELERLVRFPSDDLVSEKIFRDRGASRPMGPGQGRADLLIGVNEHMGRRQDVKISSAVHSVLIGGTGTGKSSLLMRAMLATAEQNRGFCLIDPHGDLVDDVISRLPDNRVDDVILFDPADREFPIGFNVLEAHSETEKMFLASDLTATFRRYSTTFGDVMDAVLENAVLAFLESSRGGTLHELKRFLAEKEFRTAFLESVNDPAIKYFWNFEFPHLPGKPQNSIVVRLDTFLRQKLVRNVVIQKNSGLNFRDVFEKRKILLIRLSQGLIGEENAALLGTLLISRLYQIALTRQELQQERRSLFSVFIDEASAVSTPSLALILSNLRKFGIALTLATQTFRHFENRDKNIADAVLANCQNRICFRLGDTDAEKLSRGFAHFDARALQNLSRGEAIMRIDRAENDFNLRTFPPSTLSGHQALERRDEIRKNSRERYATPLVKLATQVQSSQEAINVVRPPAEDIYDSGHPEPEADPVFRTQATESRITSAASTYHREIQGVIKRMAEAYGFEARLEEHVPGGRVDVSLTLGEIRIACEVSVTTTDYEQTNCVKSFNAGYDRVIVVASIEKKIPLLNRKLRAGLSPAQFAKIDVVTLGGLLQLLKRLAERPDEHESQRNDRGQSRLNLSGACKFFGVSPSTLYRWIRQGRLPFYRVGREYQFERDELVLIGRSDLSAKQKGAVKLEPLDLGGKKAKGKKEQDAKYRKLLKLD